MKIRKFIDGVLDTFNIFGNATDFQERYYKREFRVSDSFKEAGWCLKRGIEQYEQKDTKDHRKQSISYTPAK